MSWGRENLASTPAHLRDFGLVFQDYALFPHLNVFENVAFGPKMKGWRPDAIRRRVDEVLQMVDLAGFEQRDAATLSGGEQQRVALARALAPRPRLLMFDEPLGALDRTLRDDLILQLREILGRTRIPSLYVTHDQEEAFRIADRILLLHEGQIVRAGTPKEVWELPGSAWAAQFLGLGSIVRGIVVRGNRRAKTEYGTVAFKCGHEHRPGDDIALLVRPVPAEGGSTISGSVRETIFQNDKYRVLLSGGLYLDLDDAPRIGSNIRVTVIAECLGAPPRS